MPFQPAVNQELVIDGVTYRIAEHPAAPGMPYGQEGRAAIVYQLVAGADRRALKVFKPRYRLPALVGLADKLAAFADMPGLQVCRRAVLTPQRHAALLRQYPDLTYAVLMPWVEGPTWMEVLLDRRELSAAESLNLARSLAEILSTMEQRGLAHCDLSSPNVLLPALAGERLSGNPLAHPSAVALVDVEQVYAPGLTRPDPLTSGSSGYAHKTAPEGIWAAHADRFAGAVLLAEMLGWCDPQAVEAAWGESYFDPGEMQQDCQRYRLLVESLRRRWGEGVAGLLERTWRSETLADCPTFGEWLIALPERPPVGATLAVAPEAVAPEGAGAGPAPTDLTRAQVQALIGVARQLEEAGNLEGALTTYRQAQALAAGDPALAGLAREIGLIAQDLEGAEAKGGAADSRAAPSVASVPVAEAERPSAQAENRTLPAFPQRRAGWRTWLAWVLAITIGGTVALALDVAVQWAITHWTSAEPWMYYLVYLMISTVLPVSEWLVLRHHFRQAGWWILAGILSMATHLAVNLAVVAVVRRPEIAATVFLVLGMATDAIEAVLQWLVLRRHFRQAGWWILASTIAWAVAWAVGQAVGTAVNWSWVVEWEVEIGGGYSLFRRPVGYEAVSGSVARVIGGLLTGAVLVWILRRPRLNAHRQNQSTNGR